MITIPIATDILCSDFLQGTHLRNFVHFRFSVGIVDSIIAKCMVTMATVDDVMLYHVIL